MRSYILGLLGGITGTALVLGAVLAAQQYQGARAASVPPTPTPFLQHTTRQVLNEFTRHGLYVLTPVRSPFMVVFIDPAPGGTEVTEFSVGSDQVNNGLLVVCDNSAAFSVVWGRLSKQHNLRPFAQDNVILAFAQSNGLAAQRYEAVLAALR
jgi:hypothetical protein